MTSAKAFVGIGLHHEDPRYQKVQEQEAPYVSIGDVRQGHFWVASNDEQGGFLATTHLLGMAVVLFIMSACTVIMRFRACVTRAIAGRCWKRGLFPRKP